MQCVQYVSYSLLVLASKTYGMYEGASKQSPDPKNSISPGPRTPVMKFLDPPLRGTISRKLDF